MLFWLLHYFQQHLALRALTSACLALLVTFLLGPVMIRRLTAAQVRQPIREDGPKAHQKKAGTPTMGGLLILVAVIFSVLLCADLNNAYVWLVLFTLLAFGGIGFYDDYKKMILKNSKGLSARLKIVLQSTFALCIVGYLYLHAAESKQLFIIVPFFKHVLIDLGAFYPVLAYFVITGSSNAVNLTDGLDGLAILPVVLIAGALGIFACISGTPEFAHYVQLPHIPGVGELVVVTSAIVGAGLGFLWFNAYPAVIFMGDLGALALGAALGVIAIAVSQELLFFIMGGVFVAETVSVILQVACFKCTGGKRIFKMAPLHHHFELSGWPESRIVIRFWIITAILVLLGLATLF